MFYTHICKQYIIIYINIVPIHLSKCLNISSKQNLSYSRYDRKNGDCVSIMFRFILCLGRGDPWPAHAHARLYAQARAHASIHTRVHSLTQPRQTYAHGQPTPRKTHAVLSVRIIPERNHSHACTRGRARTHTHTNTHTRIHTTTLRS